MELKNKSTSNQTYRGEQVKGPNMNFRYEKHSH